MTNQRTSNFIIIEKRAFQNSMLVYSLHKESITVEYFCSCILHVNKGYTRDKPFLFPHFFKIFFSNFLFCNWWLAVTCTA